MKKYDALQRVVGTFKACSDVYEEHRDITRISYDMTRAKTQWSPDLKSELEAKRVPVLAINTLGADLRALLGLLSQYASSIKVEGRDKTKDQIKAQVINTLLYTILSNSNFDDENVLENCESLQAGFGVYEVSTKQDADEPEEEIIVRNKPSENIMIDPDARYVDQRDWRYVITWDWFTAEELIAAYDGIVTEKDFGTSWYEDIVNVIRSVISRGRALETTEEDWTIDNKLRVVHLWEEDKTPVKMYKTMNGYVDYQPPDGTPYETVKLYRRRIKVTSVCPAISKVLQEKVTSYKYFPFAITLPLNLNGGIIHTSSWVEEMTGLQQEKNRLRSAMADIISKSANNNWVVPKGEDVLKDDMQNRMSQYGSVFIRETITGALQSLTPTFPSNIQALLNQNGFDEQKIGGITPVARGEQGGAQSGEQYDSMVAQSEAPIRHMVNQDGCGLKMLGKILIDFIRVHYDSDQAIKIIGEEDPRLTQDIVLQVMLDIKQTPAVRYDLAIILSPYLDTKRMAEQVDRREIIKSVPEQLQAVLIPEYVRNTTSESKDELAQKLEGMMGGQQEQQQPPQ